MTLDEAIQWVKDQLDKKVSLDQHTLWCPWAKKWWNENGIKGKTTIRDIMTEYSLSRESLKGDPGDNFAIGICFCLPYNFREQEFSSDAGFVFYEEDLLPLEILTLCGE